MAKIKVNDQLQELPDGTSVASLLALNKVPQSDMVSVQLNGEFVLREDYESVALKDDDEVDFLYFMGGGR
jgi:sulfur carrier protein